VKRAFDVVVALVAAILFLPILAIVAILVAVTMGRPVLFRQQRPGLRGKPFRLVKFRTMRDDAEQLRRDLDSANETVGLFKLAQDPRVTRVGRFLRRSSLDELPQLINVLRGEMSLVGPRPLVVEEDARVEGWRRHRLVLKPGMTGAWQIMGHTRVPLEQMAVMDYLYIVNWSLWNDVKILLRTARHVAGRRGL
jgi:lipopolysaccharide/colanic/teichoic acid biosynthesis glycosyltransferase